LSARAFPLQAPPQRQFGKLLNVTAMGADYRAKQHMLFWDRVIPGIKHDVRLKTLVQRVELYKFVMGADRTAESLKLSLQEFRYLGLHGDIIRHGAHTGRKARPPLSFNSINPLTDARS